MSESLPLKSNSNHYEEYIKLKESIHFSSNQYFIYYLNDIYNDLLNRIPKQILKEQKNDIPNGIPEIIFTEFLDYQFFICEKLFNAFDKKKQGFLNKQEFINGIYNLYSDSFRENAEIIFSLYDFNKDGFINKDDMKLLLSYIPSQENEYKKQIKLLRELDQILKETFDEENEEITFEQYLIAIKNKNSESFIRLMIYFYNNKPFELDNINSYQYLKKKPLLKNQFKKNLCLVTPMKLNSQLKKTEKKIFQSLQKNIKLSKEKENTKTSFRIFNRHSSIKNLPCPIELFKGKKEIFPKKKYDSSSNLIRNDSINHKSPNTIPYNKMVKNKGRNILFKSNLRKRKSIGDSFSNTSKESFSNLPILNSPKSMLQKGNRSKYKLSPVNQVFNKFSPQNNISNNFNEFEEPPDFTLCDENDNDNEIDFKLEITEDKSDENNFEKEKNNENQNNNLMLSEERKFSISKKLDSFKKFKASLPKYNVSFEDYLFKYDDNKSQILKRYFCVFKGYDLLFFTSNLKNELESILNIKGCYIKQGENLSMGKELYYTVKIIYSNNKKRLIYFLSETTRNKWYNKLKESIKNYDFNLNYTLKEQIGEGYFGKVQKAINLKTNKEYAVKVINKSKLSLKNYKLIHHEMNIMKLLNHPNIVSLVDYFEDDEFIYIVMDYLSGGDLLEYIGNKEELISEKIACRIIKNIAKGIKYMNLFGLIHRDLKPENIVFEKKDDIKSLKIIDFGLTKTLGRQEKTNEAIGTITYLAPEIFTHKPYNHKVDIWSIGIILYFLLSGCLPFDDEKLDDQIIGKKVVFSHQEYPKEYFGNRNPGVLNLIDKCLEKNPDKRISVNEFLKDEWILRQSN